MVVSRLNGLDRFTFSLDSALRSCEQDKRPSFRLNQVMVDQFTCKECGRIVSGYRYEDKRWSQFVTMKKMRLCEECIHHGNDEL